ncbi:MAG: LemA family protein [Planctomycetes bacterium]|nr:LemA family protein [Planctomycetota bacterium]
MNPAIVVAIVAFLLLVFVFGMYNRLVRARNHCNEAWFNIDTELKRRYDLIPNLVSCVKGYASYERDLLERITALRQECVANTGSPSSQAESENKLIRALSALLVRVENYPNLKASQNYLQLQTELVNTEDRIQAARRFYNGNVRENNNLVEMFPTNILAGMFGFTRREFFEIADIRERAVSDAGL